MRRYYRSILLFSIFFVGLVSFSTSAFALSADSFSNKPDFVRIFYYQEGKNAYNSFLKHMDSIDVLAPQTYYFDINGNLKGGVKDSLVSLSQKNKIKIMPLVTNTGFGQKALKAILDNETQQELAIKSLVDEAKKNNYWGWQIDFEQMDLSYRNKFSDFVRKFGEEMEKNGLESSVAVVAQISENPNDYPNDLWQKLIGAYDYKSIGSSVDFVSVMSYDDPESDGPVARYSWMQRVIDHSLKYIPNEKLSLGLPLYYWKWDDKRGKLVDIGGYTSLQKTINTNKIKKGYSITEQAPYIQYKKNKKSYTIWYENAKSIQKKLELITKNELYGFSAWALGLEVPDIHRIIKD